ncbi:hypothetical protein BKA70DRAFT_1408632 [Coprinopsis sp. MPI-PUGE-AT-0042]|nr:hypothetical protein BKA70DRAFT_1408632 [Coprinopsis sp. MPI-PUGE-AT-0042]
MRFFLPSLIAISLGLPLLASSSSATDAFQSRDRHPELVKTSPPLVSVAPSLRSLMGAFEASSILDRRSPKAPNRSLNKGRKPALRPSSKAQVRQKTKPQPGSAKPSKGKAQTKGKKAVSCRLRKFHRRSIYESLFARSDDCGQGKLELLSKARESVITKITDSRNQQQERLKMEQAVIQDGIANMHKKVGGSGVVAPVLVDWGASPSHDKTLK